MGAHCSECDAEFELDEPQTCYFTGRGPCGDCSWDCFLPLICDDCRSQDPTPPEDLDQVSGDDSDEHAPPHMDVRARRRTRIEDHIRTREYYEKVRETRRHR